MFTDLTDLDVKLKLRQNYTKYNGAIRSGLDLDSAFRAEDNASSSEIASEAQGTEVTIGDQFKAVEENEATTTPKYSDSKKGANDAPTPEEVAAWVAAGRPKAGGNDAGSQAAPAANVFAGGQPAAGAPAQAFPGAT